MHRLKQSRAIAKNCRLPAVILALGLLIGCASPYQGVTSGASALPVGMEAGSSMQQACVQSCDSAFARCMDAGSARREAESVTATVYGNRFDCEASLRNCLPKCRAR
jgi:hypothetical protein